MHRILLLSILILLVLSCERPFELEVQADAEQLVVEGFIEASNRQLPPLVILTRSQPFFRAIDSEQLDQLFVHDALVEISHAEGRTQLQEICYSELPPDLQDQFAELAGLDAAALPFDFCVYTDLLGSLSGTAGQHYDLYIEAEGKSLKASTSIPYGVPLDSLWFVPPPGIPTDTLAQLRAIISDPPDTVNFYRYFTQADGAMLPGFPSVTDDRLFDGTAFEFPLPKGESRNIDIDPNTYGLFTVGPKATIRWTCLDQAHFNFWNTLE
ncbi:MAG: DUF4249 family protein, partial [Phaeodactylibacter sp.]|nr:DUF4249 family protein [Phaeodactylibacter sp.]